MQTATSLPVLSPGGRIRARRLVSTLALCAVVSSSLIASAPRAAASSTSDDPVVTVVEAAGVFSVAARFHVPQAPAAVLAVLTDYEGIPRVMPDVKRSVVKSRSDGRVLVEQDAVSRVLFFSKAVHLVLDVRETESTLIFRDVCGQSFLLYEGSWQVAPAGDATLVTYELRAKPAFDVPDFLVKRLFKRDAAQLIARLRQAISS